MERFPFTKNKLLRQPIARQHKLVAQWLKETYLKLIEKQLVINDFVCFKQNYRMIQQWLNQDCLLDEQAKSCAKWLEIVANQYHYHKNLSGIGIAEHNLLPKVKTGDCLDGLPWTPIVSYRVALDNLRSAFNVGSIFRLVDATGFESVIVGGSTPGRDNQQVMKTSMGCTEWIPCEIETDLSSALLMLKKMEYKIIGLETVEASRNHLEFHWPKKGVIVLGNEEYGVSQQVLQCCDSFVHIPMQGKKNSVNVANAFSVVAFHVAFNQQSNRTIKPQLC